MLPTSYRAMRGEEGKKRKSDPGKRNSTRSYLANAPHSMSSASEQRSGMAQKMLTPTRRTGKVTLRRTYLMIVVADTRLSGRHGDRNKALDDEAKIEKLKSQIRNSELSGVPPSRAFSPIWMTCTSPWDPLAKEQLFRKKGHPELDVTTSYILCKPYYVSSEKTEGPR
jgi:hypothetical protein